MSFSASHPAASTYRVEVSGWDSSQSFFVEKSELEWNEQSGKHLTLSRSLLAGTMIFVRLLQPTASDRSCPVPYRAEYIATTPEGGRQFRLNQVKPHPDKREPSPR
jgi:hypothetical protein